MRERNDLAMRFSVRARGANRPRGVKVRAQLLCREGPTARTRRRIGQERPDRSGSVGFVPGGSGRGRADDAPTG